MKLLLILFSLCLSLISCNGEKLPLSTSDPSYEYTNSDESGQTYTEPTVLEPLKTDVVNDEYSQLLMEIRRIADESGLSISYISCNKEHHFTINGGTRFDSASTIKAIYCQYLMSTGVDLEQKIMFDQLLDRDSFSGIFIEKNLGCEFTVRELMEYSIRYSDNASYRLLFITFGYHGYNDWVSSLGIPGLAFASSYEFTEVSARDLSLGMVEVYRYGLQDSTLIDMLKSTEFKMPIALGTNHEVASKYGFNGGTAGYHDTAIVYAPEPYALTILSNIYPYPEHAIQPFLRVTELTDRLNELLNE